MRNKKDKKSKAITPNDFVQRDEFHSYTAPVPTSAGRRNSRAAAKAAAEKKKRMQEEKLRQQQLRQAKIDEEKRRLAQEQEERLAAQQAEQQEKAEYERLVAAEVERNKQIIRQKKMREQAELERLMAQKQEQEKLAELEQFQQESLETLSESRAKQEEKPKIVLSKTSQFDAVDDSADYNEEADTEPEDTYEDDETPSFTYVELKNSTEEQPVEEKIPEEEEEEPVRHIERKSAADAAKVTDIRQARKKQKTKKIRTKIIVLSVLLAVGVGVFATNKYWVPMLEGILDKPHSTIVNDGKTEAGNFPIQLDDSTASFIDNCGGYMVRLDDNHIVFYNENGESVSTFAHNYGSPVMEVAGKRVLAYDMAGNDFEVVNRKNQVFAKQTSNPILLAKLAADGSSAVVTQTEKYSAYLTIYDANGNEIYTWASGRRITDICFNDKGDGCVISTIASSGGSVKSVIYYVTFDKQDAVMQSEQLDTLAVSACVTENNQYWVVGDDRFIKLDESGKTLSECEYSDTLVSYALSSSYASVLTDSVERGHGNLITFDADSENNDPSSKVLTDGNPKKLRLVNGTSVLLNDKTALSYDINGNLLATAQVSTDYIGFTYFGGSVYFLGYHEINKIAFDT